MAIEGFTGMSALPSVQCDLAMLLVTLERGRQIFGKGYDPAHDDDHAGAELAAAAACYAAGGEVSVDGRRLWPWPGEPAPSAAVAELRRLAIAGALLLAEIERLLRAGADPQTALAADLPPEMLDVLALAAQQPSGLCRCIGCGCDDRHACQDEFGEPCGWLRIDREAGVGVCSECPEAVALWDDGGRAVAVDAVDEQGRTLHAVDTILHETLNGLSADRQHVNATVARLVEMAQRLGAEPGIGDRS